MESYKWFLSLAIGNFLGVQTMSDVPCPWCGWHSPIIDITEDVIGKTSPNRPPKTGDFIICFHCVLTSRFNENLEPQKIGDEELQRIMSADEYASMMKGR